MNLYKNRKAYHNYFIKDTFETGIVLSSSEVKSCVDGHVNGIVIKDSQNAGFGTLNGVKFYDQITY